MSNFPVSSSGDWMDGGVSQLGGERSRGHGLKRLVEKAVATITNCITWSSNQSARMCGSSSSLFKTANSHMKNLQ